MLIWGGAFTVTDIGDATEALARVKRDFSWDPWFDCQSRISRGSRHIAQVVNIVPFGCFVEMPDGLHGLVHSSNINGFAVGPGDRVEVEVKWIDAVQRKMSLILLDVIQEDAGDLFGPSSL